MGDVLYSVPQEDAGLGSERQCLHGPYASFKKSVEILHSQGWV